MDGFKVLSCANKDAAKWQALIDQLPLEYRDIMFTPAYARVQEVIGQGPCYAAVYIWQDYFILQPFMQRGSELVSFYGGGGPISNLMGAADYRLWLWFEQEFAKWRKDCRITSEYVRLHPRYDRVQRRMLRESGIEVQHLREAVVVDINKNDENLLKSFSRNRQRGVKGSPVLNLPKTEGVPIRAEQSHDLDTFAAYYNESMRRLGATPNWIYRNEVWGSYMFELGDEFCTFFKTQGAMLLVLHGYGKAYAQFLGSIEPKANDGIYYDSMRYCRDVGCQTYFLGGGTTSNIDDPLLTYKSGFSALRAPVSYYKRSFVEATHADSSAALTTQLDLRVS